MRSQPGVAELHRVGVQRVLGETVLGARRAKALFPRGIVAGQRPGVLEGFGLAHQPHPLAGLTQAGGSDLPCCLQAREQRVLLVRTHSQRDLADKGGRSLGAQVSGSARGRHGFLMKVQLGQSF